MWSSTSRAALLALALAACAHDDPWAPGYYGPNGPLDGGSPGRLTLSTGVDAEPAWLPRDTALLYATEPGDRADGDRCLGVFSAVRWTEGRALCRPAAIADDSVDFFDWPAASADGQVAYLWTVSVVGAQFPTRRSLVVGPLRPFQGGERVVAVYPSSRGSGGGVVTDGATHLGWIDATDLVFVRAVLTITFDRLTNSWDSTEAGIDIERLDPTAAAPVAVPVAGTSGATSVATDGGRAIYYTLSGDPSVYRQQIDSGAVTVAHTFGGAPPTDVAVRGSRLVAVAGGVVHVVDLGSGGDAPFSAPGVSFSHPALSGGGRVVVVDGISPGSRPDLWRITLP